MEDRKLTMTRLMAGIFWLPTRIADTRVVAVLSVIGFGVVIFAERDYATLPFLIGIFGVIFALLSLASGRTAFAILCTWTLLALVTAISAVKTKLMGVALHVFDLYFYLRDMELITFLAYYYFAPLLLCAVFLFGGALACCVIFRCEMKQPLRRVRIVALLAMSFALTAASYPKAAKGHDYYFDYHVVSSFFASLTHARYLFSETELAKRLAIPSHRSGYAGALDCSAPKRRPDIIAVLMESAMPPATYPILKAPQWLNQTFQSADGKIHQLQVETFGGVTAISTTGLLTSLPTVEFGWMRPYLPLYLHGNIHYSLAKLLKRCGYKTAIISPQAYPFVNEGPFMTSLGIDDYRDFRAIGAKTKQEPDSVYFDAAVEYIAQHKKRDGRPLFILVMTMATHAPYWFRLDPTIQVPGEPFGNEPQIDEYLRRLAMQRIHFDGFLKRLNMITSHDGALVLDFGDHQPMFARKLAETDDRQRALARWDSIAYKTYYNITAVNMRPAIDVPDLPSLDIAYLGPTLLQMAGLPLDDVYAELAALRVACHGTFALCSDRLRVERHLKRLAKGGLINLALKSAEAEKLVEAK